MVLVAAVSTGSWETPGVCVLHVSTLVILLSVRGLVPTTFEDLIPRLLTEFDRGIDTCPLIHETLQPDDSYVTYNPTILPDGHTSRLRPVTR